MGLWVKFNDVMCTTNSIYRNFDLFHCTRVFQSFNKNNKVYFYMKKLNSIRINTIIVCKTERKQYKYLYTYTKQLIKSDHAISLQCTGIFH